MARPTKYKEEYNDLAYKHCLLGATDADLALFFDVNVDSIQEWKKVHPEFSDSIKQGKEIADNEVASKLFHRATGYEHEEVDIRVVGKKIVQTKLIKHYPPDTSAMIFWLKNRRKDLWRDKIDTDVTSNGETISNMIMLPAKKDDDYDKEMI